jgi:hypothetical protein
MSTSSESEANVGSRPETDLPGKNRRGPSRANAKFHGQAVTGFCVLICPRLVGKGRRESPTALFLQWPDRAVGRVLFSVLLQMAGIIDSHWIIVGRNGWY